MGQSVGQALENCCIEFIIDKSCTTQNTEIDREAFDWQSADDIHELCRVSIDQPYGQIVDVRTYLKDFDHFIYIQPVQKDVFRVTASFTKTG